MADGDASAASPAVFRLFWPQHLQRVDQAHWLLGWAWLSDTQTLGKRQQLLSVIVAGVVPQSSSVRGVGQFCILPSRSPCILWFNTYLRHMASERLLCSQVAPASRLPQLCRDCNAAQQRRHPCQRSVQAATLMPASWGCGCSAELKHSNRQPLRRQQRAGITMCRSMAWHRHSSRHLADLQLRHQQWQARGRTA